MKNSFEKPDLLVSVIVPCRNEVAFLPDFLEDLLHQTLPLDRFEVIVLDGMSDDGSREVLQAYSKRFPYFQVVDNPARYVPQALNKGISMARAPYIARLDVHASYPPDYLKKLLHWQQQTGADNIGGLCRTLPRSRSPRARAIATALSHPLGVGNSDFRTGSDEVREVDTVPFGFFPRSTFERYGLFDERLVRNQDIEFNKRIIRNGGRVLLVPEIHSAYFARDRLGALWQNMFSTGEWVVRAVRLTGHWSALSLRHFIPALFVLYLFTLPMAIFWGLTANPVAGIAPSVLSLMYALPAVLYLLLIAAVSLKLAIAQKDWRLAIYLPPVFFIMHLAYGLGSWKAALKLN